MYTEDAMQNAMHTGKGFTGTFAESKLLHSDTGSVVAKFTSGPALTAKGFSIEFSVGE